ncbi:MAG: hypothetical protein EPN37_00075 [Chitinophagaceae bacterium]|nr:MAG: hypothetical protein EPN37_00075 [Chitinophagaceae bacterium]
MENNQIKIGFVSFGEVNSPKEFLENKRQEALKELMSLGIEIISTVRVVTDDRAENDVSRAIHDLKRETFDTLVICILGWIPSHTVIKVTEEFKHKPIILWGVSGNIKNEHIVTTAAQAGTSALRKTFEDLGYKFIYVYNIINKPSPLKRIKSFLLAGSATKIIRSQKIGMMGFRDMKLYNTLYEGVSLKATLGIDVDFFEMHEIFQISEAIEAGLKDEIYKRIIKEWEFIQPVDEGFLRKGITYYLAIKKVCDENRYNAISLKDVDGMKRILNFPPAIIFMLLSDQMHLCTIPENDVMGAATQLIIKQITGQCAAYFEFYEFFEQGILMGVPDFVPSEIVVEKVRVTQAAFGGITGGLLNVSTVKTGKLTLARLSYSGNKYYLHICTGESKLRSWEEAGWDQPAPQLPSFEIFLDSPMEEFAQKISSQHYIVAYGDHKEALSDFCYLNGIQVI